MRRGRALEPKLSGSEVGNCGRRLPLRCVISMCRSTKMDDRALNQFTKYATFLQPPTSLSWGLGCASVILL